MDEIMNTEIRHYCGECVHILEETSDFQHKTSVVTTCPVTNKVVSHFCGKTDCEYFELPELPEGHTYVTSGSCDDCAYYLDGHCMKDNRYCSAYRKNTSCYTVSCSGYVRNPNYPNPSDKAIEMHNAMPKKSEDEMKLVFQRFIKGIHKSMRSRYDEYMDHIPSLGFSVEHSEFSISQLIGGYKDQAKLEAAYEIYVLLFNERIDVDYPYD